MYVIWNVHALGLLALITSMCVCVCVCTESSAARDERFSRLSQRFESVHLRMRSVNI